MKLDWKKRIDICKTILSDMKDMIPDECEEGKEEIAITLQGIEDYTSDEVFLENADKDKETDSWNIWMNTIRNCYEQLDLISDKLYPKPVRYVTRDEAYAKLLEEYAQGISEGDDTVASMNINDWMAENGFVLVEEDDARRSSSSDGDDGETVNSRTKF